MRYELLAAVYRQQWAEVDALCRRLQYWNPSGRSGGNLPAYLAAMGYLLDWAQAEATWYLQSRSNSAKPPGPSAGHPLLERLSKEGYTVAAEFQAALASHSYREACQIIADTTNLPGTGLVPSPADPALLTSLRAMMEAAIRDLPPLRATMEEHAGSLGQLRVKQAIAAGQAEAVEAVCTQFPGTRAAAAAHLWLADREMSAGRIAAATTALESALAGAAAEQRPAIEARLRLAGGLIGRGSRPAGPGAGRAWLAANAGRGVRALGGGDSPAARCGRSGGRVGRSSGCVSAGPLCLPLLGAVYPRRPAAMG